MVSISKIRKTKAEAPATQAPTFGEFEGGLVG